MKSFQLSTSLADVSSEVVCFLSQGASVGLYFINRPEWIIVDNACAAYSYVSVPLYDTLGSSILNTNFCHQIQLYP